MIYPVLNIAKYIIKHEHDAGREISNLRLQKLLYFVQAKFLAEKRPPCFSDPIEAWDFGPVVLSVYHEYKMFGGLDILTSETECSIDSETSSVIDNILDYCAPYPSYQLSDIAHSQQPYIRARQNLFSTVITIDAMRQFFQKE